MGYLVSTASVLILGVTTLLFVVIRDGRRPLHRWWFDRRWIAKIRRECKHPSWRVEVHTRRRRAELYCYECGSWLRARPSSSSNDMRGERPFS